MQWVWVVLIASIRNNSTVAIMTKSTYTRPGVAAAARLASIESLTIWKRTESQYSDMISEKGGDKLLSLDKFCDELGEKLTGMTEPFISEEELFKVVEWKFAKGKPRYALMKYLKANGEDSIKKASREAFASVDEDDIQASINKFCQLKGVGPATASAILSLYKPDLFSFMDDEVIECLFDGKRGYTLKIYMAVNNKCAELATTLGSAWTPRRVGKALWTASRICASGGDDLTVGEDNPEKDTKELTTVKRESSTKATKTSKKRRTR
mmetsp:Transcript_15696/g.28548  ORF Transcript_15696/g.28548 Transcript_15696/m.28548 type:complete len:267 (-) Transcript_15696:1348-2148(-)